MKFDAIIIGFGKAGKTLAGFLAKKGEKVALIERSEKMYGGTCINIGCIPTKTLVHSAHLARRDVSWKEKQEYFRAAMEQKDAVVSFLREKNYEKLADDPNVTIFLGVGSFAGKNAVEVRGKDLAVTLEAPKIFINTGSETVIPNLPGVTGNPRVFTSTTLLDLKELPQRPLSSAEATLGSNSLQCLLLLVRRSRCSKKGPKYCRAKTAILPQPCRAFWKRKACSLRRM